MLPTQKKQFTNRLAQFRRMRKLDQKQVARLLGFRSVTRIEKFEKGIAVPDLKATLKLAQIFNIPVRILLDQYYEACLAEVKGEERRLMNARPTPVLSKTQQHAAEFCTYEARFDSKPLNEQEISLIRRHSTFLIRKVAEKLGHI